MLLKIYSFLTRIGSPLVAWWLTRRLKKGKEDAVRLGERFGYTTHVRPKELLVWIHAASVGEANSALALISAIRNAMPESQIMVTTSTLTSAHIMAARLSHGTFHQYVPVDTPQATQRFIDHWQPDIAIWIESELWPNLLEATRLSGAVMLLVNARMSERSFRRWKKMKRLFHDITKGFDAIYASSGHDAIRFQELGCSAVNYAGNLKFDAAPLETDATQLAALKPKIGTRPVWLAASTHEGEELQVLEAHRTLASHIPDILTIIIPRHAHRGDGIAEKLRAHTIKLSQRSKHEEMDADTQIYLADTMNELGLFYRLCDVVWMGGTFASVGGHNPIEPAQLGCALLAGPSRHNFEAIMKSLIDADAMMVVNNADELADKVGHVLQHKDQRDAMKHAAQALVKKSQGVVDNVVAFIESTQAMRH